jgi:hypothetical protein
MSFLNEQTLIPIIGIVLTIIGWIVVFILGNRSLKIQLRNSVKLEIYKQLYDLKLDIDKVSVNLGLSLSFYSLPFLEMKWSGEKSSINSEGKNAGQIWLEHINKINTEKSNFIDAYLKFWDYVNMWRAELSQVSKARDILFTELGGLAEEISKYSRYLSDLLLKESYDWIKWDQKLIEETSNQIEERFNMIAISYLSDFIDLIHIELIQPIFRKKRISREDYNYFNAIVSKALTKDGIEKIKFPPTRIAKLRKKAPTETHQ